MSTGHIPVSLQRCVRLQASERCEYCRIAQVGQEATFHVDHVMPQAAGGLTSLENLALAQSDHFMADVSGEILGLTAIGLRQSRRCP
jgi:hypothetical protein